MEGYYTFHCLYYKDKFFNVTIPRFHMVCPTFKVSTARMVSADAVVFILDYFSLTSCFLRTLGLILIGECNCVFKLQCHITFQFDSFLENRSLFQNHFSKKKKS